MIKKFLVFISFFFFALFTIPFYLSTVFAADEFATSYDVTYDVGEDGVTTVTEKVTLKNLTSQYYATEFKLTIGATQLSDIRATDGGGALEVKSEKTGTSTTLSVKFNQQVAGMGKELPWTLSFKSKDFASKQGKVWEVSAPKVSSTTNLENYNLTLAVPLSFGDPTLISPTPKSQTTNFGKRFLTFDKNQLISAGVSASFGTHQLFDFDLTYNLENNSLLPILTTISLPPDTAYQDVIYQRIDPAPLNVTVDEDGNYLAWFKLNRAQKISVKAIGSAKLYTTSKVKSPTLEPNLRQIYTSSTKYWEKDNPAIKSRLAEILGNETENTEKAKLIHRYVVDHLKYDTSRLSSSGIERFGAVTALNNPESAVCMEYTDLFIALARAAGIPSRELDGFAYTSNTTLRPLSLNRDILHAWPEYWDESKGWVMIDPTWESTTGGVDYFNKLDLNHFVFTIKGHSSEIPVPAGSYKYANQDSHDVKVGLSEVDFTGKPQLNVVVEVDEPILAGLPGKIKVRMPNQGNALQTASDFRVEANKLTILNSPQQTSGPIPAFGEANFEFNIRTKSLFESFDDTITVSVAGQKFVSDIKVRPFFLFQNFPVIALAVFAPLVLIYLAVLGGFIYRRRYLQKTKS